MSDSKEFYILLDLVKYGLDFNRYYWKEYYNNTDLNAVKWEKVFNIAKQHRVTAISYDGLMNLYSVEEFFLHKDLLEKWAKNAEEQKIIDLLQKKSLDRLQEKLEEEKIYYFIFKGFTLKNLYKKTYFREMSDLDILVSQDKLNCVEDILITMGYELPGKIGNINFNANIGKLLHIDVQSELFTSYYYPEIYQYFKSNGPRIKNGYLLEWDTTNEYIYLFIHLYKHFHYGGIGIRFILDLWLFNKKYHEEIDWEKVNQTFTNLNLIDDYKKIINLSVDWFEENVYGRDELLEEYILSNGLFGSLDQYIINKMKKEKSYSAYMWKRTFPSKEFMKIRYPEMRDSYIVLPYYWTKRLIYSFKHNWKSIQSQLKIIFNLKYKSTN